MPHVSKAVCVAAFLLAACQTDTSNIQNRPASIADANPPITAEGAVKLFDDTCGATLPDFENADVAFAANNITASIGTATRYSTDYNVSFQIKDGPGFGKSCSMVFATANSFNTETFLRTISELGALGQSQIGPVGKYRDSDALYTLSGPPTTLGEFTYHNLILFSER